MDRSLTEATRQRSDRNLAEATRKKHFTVNAGAPRFLTFRLTFGVERNVWTRVPVLEESLLCAGTCSIQLSELSTGYGKFEYTREGVNQLTGVCLSRKAG